MPRLTDTCGLCYSCGLRPATHDYAPPQGGVLGYCYKCISRVIAYGAKQSADGVFEIPIAHQAYVERNARNNGSRAICTCGWHAGWGTEANAVRYAARHQERPDLNPIYPPRGTVYECDGVR